MSSGSIRNVVIIGAGQAGLHTAQSLRKRGYAGHIAMLGDEGYAPYQRPPLSKAFLKGAMEERRLAFKPETFYRDQSIELHVSAATEAIDPDEREVRCADGKVFEYDRLIVATGATPLPIPVPGASLDGVFMLRGLDDSKSIRTALVGAARVVVIGGGYIGLEAASAARQLGHEVTVLERLPRLLPRVTTAPISAFYLDLHREHGVDVRLGSTVVGIEGDGCVSAVRLESGDQISAEVVLVGIGVRPNQDLAEAAGIQCDDGILVDAECRTSREGVYAAGDCARSRLPDGTTQRLESVHNALVQGEHIAADLVGDPSPAFDPPWFWSDQYDVKLQTVGLFRHDDDILVRGDTSAKKFSALYFRDDELVALDCVNDPLSFMSGKQILKKGIVVHRDDLSDPEVVLKEFVARQRR
jgi:3-phenylpropionate/trans-cinnamate dioxygenase ferredoxin reductase subunit